MTGETKRKGTVRILTNIANDANSIDAKMCGQSKRLSAYFTRGGCPAGAIQLHTVWLVHERAAAGAVVQAVAADNNSSSIAAFVIHRSRQRDVQGKMLSYFAGNVCIVPTNIRMYDSVEVRSGVRSEIVLNF